MRLINQKMENKKLKNKDTVPVTKCKELEMSENELRPWGQCIVKEKTPTTRFACHQDFA